MSYNILDYGAVGDGVTDSTAAIQKTIDAAAAAGGGQVIVPAGKAFVAGPFELKSNMDFHLEPGSEIRAKVGIEHYPLSDIYNEGPESDGKRWVWAQDADRLSITGTGMFHARGVEWMGEEFEHGFKWKQGRPFMLCLENCRQVTLRDVTFKDSPFWTVHLTGCEDVSITGIRILNNTKLPNSDGINPDCCRNVRISGCHIEAGDDCICVKSEKAVFEKYGVCENIVVSDCTLISTSCALKIGTGTHGMIRNVIFDACVITNTHRGLGLVLRDPGSIENVIFSNIIIETRHFAPNWWGASEPIYVSALKRDPNINIGAIRNIRFRNILCRSESGVYIAGIEDSPIEDIVLENVRLEIERRTEFEGGFYDPRPNPERSTRPHEIAGFYFDHAEQAALRNCAVYWQGELPDYFTHAVNAENMEGMVIEGLEGDAAFRRKYDAVRILSE